MLSNRRSVIDMSVSGHPWRCTVLICSHLKEDKERLCEEVQDCFKLRQCESREIQGKGEREQKKKRREEWRKEGKREVTGHMGKWRQAL